LHPSRPARCAVHLPQGRTTHSPWLLAMEEDRPGARCLTRCTGSHVSGRRRVPEGQICISPNNQRFTRWHVLVVSANDPPRVGATDSEEARRIQANANCT
jgi:hypothetical protein